MLTAKTVYATIEKIEGSLRINMTDFKLKLVFSH